MHKSIFFFFLLFLFGCNNNQENRDVTLRYHDDGKAKPSISFVPFLDSTDAHYSWSLSEEFVSLIKKDLSKNGKFFLNKNKLDLSENTNFFKPQVSINKDKTGIGEKPF